MISVKTLIAVILVLTIGCTPITPEVRIWQPWTRIGGEINSVCDLSVSVEIESNILPADNSLLVQNVQSQIENLLHRRGFTISNDLNNPRNFRASIHTVRRDQLRTGYHYRPKYTVSYIQGSSSTTSSAGVAIATILSSLDIKRTVQTYTDIHTSEGYTHTLALGIFESEDLIWQGESSWDSDSPDVRDQLVSALQLLLSSLPSSENVVPEVKAVIRNKAKNFYDVYCAKRWFSCPALPYRIAFSPPSQWKETWKGEYSQLNYSGIENSEAMSAYVDLLSTSEYALPRGRTKYDQPLNDLLWSKVQVGGSYDIDGLGVTNIIIDLKGYTWGYGVTKCRIADAKEWEKFEKRQDDWEGALKEFFNFYE